MLVESDDERRVINLEGILAFIKVKMTRSYKDSKKSENKKK